MMRARTSFGLVALAALAGAAVASPAPARADGFPSFGNGLWMSTGLNIGGAFGPDRPGGVVLGGELSFPYLWWNDARWVGLYGDALRDFGLSRNRYSFGPELGVAFFGLDFGMVVQTGGGVETQLGYTGRIVLTLGFAALYVRLVKIPKAVDTTNMEAGFLFKVPYPIAVKTEPKWRPRPEPEPAPSPSVRPAPDGSSSTPPDPNAPPPVVPIPPPVPPPVPTPAPTGAPTGG
jgi:hypothetical protein